MSCAITGRVTELETGAALTSPRLALHRIGVLGETAAVLDKDGRFSFSSLHAGEYSLSAYSEEFVYWHQSLTLSEGQDADNLQIALTRGGRITGQLLDENGRPPQQGLLTLLRQGERNGRSGFISVSGDHQAGKDGRFQSPPLSSGEYILRFAGILQKPAHMSAPSQDPGLTLDRVFEFLYPDVHDVRYASAVVVEQAQTVDLQVCIPHPVRYRVRGRVEGKLPDDRQHISLQFTRRLGTLDPIGWAGGALIQSDGSFEGLEQSGNYRVEICQFAAPEPNGRTHLVRSFGSTNFTIGSEDLSDVKIQVGSEL
jgi:hypothetical protein